MSELIRAVLDLVFALEFPSPSPFQGHWRQKSIIFCSLWLLWIDLRDCDLMLQAVVGLQDTTGITPPLYRWEYTPRLTDFPSVEVLLYESFWIFQPTVPFAKSCQPGNRRSSFIVIIFSIGSRFKRLICRWMDGRWWRWTRCGVR